MKTIYPDRRRDYWVVVEFMGISRNSGTSRIWPPALDAPRKPKRFASYKEAKEFIKATMSKANV